MWGPFGAALQKKPTYLRSCLVVIKINGWWNSDLFKINRLSIWNRTITPSSRYDCKPCQGNSWHHENWYGRPNGWTRTHWFAPQGEKSQQWLLVPVMRSFLGVEEDWHNWFECEQQKGFSLKVIHFLPLDSLEVCKMFAGHKEARAWLKLLYEIAMEIPFINDLDIWIEWTLFKTYCVYCHTRWATCS